MGPRYPATGVEGRGLARLPLISPGKPIVNEPFASVLDLTIGGNESAGPCLSSVLERVGGDKACLGRREPDARGWLLAQR